MTARARSGNGAGFNYSKIAFHQWSSIKGRVSLMELAMDYDARFFDVLSALQKDELSRISMPFFTTKPAGFRDDQPSYLYVGQETFGWGAAAQYLETESREPEMIEEYRRFDLGSGANGYQPLTHTPFWAWHRKLASELGVPYQNVIWSNLVRFDGLHGDAENGSLVNPPFSALDRLLDAQDGMLESEIARFGTHGVVFVSGPAYDGVMERQLNIASRKPAAEGLSERELARIELVNFPELPVFRTYHPKYLRLSGLEARVLPVLVAGLTGRA